jgi:hypothetical protein
MFLESRGVPQAEAPLSTIVKNHLNMDLPTHSDPESIESVVYNLVYLERLRRSLNEKLLDPDGASVLARTLSAVAAYATLNRGVRLRDKSDISGILTERHDDQLIWRIGFPGLVGVTPLTEANRKWFRETAIGDTVRDLVIEKVASGIVRVNRKCSTSRLGGRFNPKDKSFTPITDNGGNRTP